MIWALALIAPFLVFAALARFRAGVRPRVLPFIEIPFEPHDAACAETVETPESTPQTDYVVEDTNSSFNRLRDAMKLDDVNLFASLQVALVDLVGLARRLEVHTHRLMPPLLTLIFQHRVEAV